MRLRTEVTAEDFDSAATGELRRTRALMPIGAIGSWLVAQPEISEWAHRRTTGSFTPLPEQIVTVRKRGHGVRPVAELFLRDELLYRAIVSAWKGVLPSPSTALGTFEEFDLAPLSDESAAYVVSSDITSFYQYIDYDVLAGELLKRTGDDGRIQDLLDLLSGLTGRRFGLPQQNDVSDVLGETYISVVHRRLSRQGLRFHRYNDDFRITADSWSSALHAVDVLEREARAVGLTLNDSKTVIRKTDHYRADLSAREELLQDIADQVELDLSDVVRLYGGDVELAPPEAAEVERGKWQAVLGEWLAAESSDGRLRYTLLTQLVPIALSRLSGDFQPEVSTACQRALRREQSLTPAVAQWMQTIPDEQHPELLSLIDDLLAADAYITPWQTAWLAPMLSRVATFADGTGGAARTDWLRRTWGDRRTPEPVIAAIAQTLARHKLVTVDELLESFDQTAETSHADLAAALGTAIGNAESPAASAIADEDWCLSEAFMLGALLA
jgi:RNA-directed DNA polymerase